MATARKKFFVSIALVVVVSAILALFAIPAMCQVEQCPDRVCYLPVTFTQQGWHDFCDPDSSIINGGMIFNRFKLAFKEFFFFGKEYDLTMIVGADKYTITYEAKTSSLQRLCLFLPQTGPVGKLRQSYLSPWSTTEAGALAGETIALTMNIAYNDTRVMPRTPGYDLELFRLAQGPLKGLYVGQVLNIANDLLGGKGQPCWFGLTSYESLTAILRHINENYEFVDYCTFIDRGYLIPNRPFGPPDPAHFMYVPFGLG